MIINKVKKVMKMKKRRKTNPSFLLNQFFIGFIVIFKKIILIFKLLYF